MTEFVGGWIAGPEEFPYEFDDGTGEHVPVHLMEFTSVEYRVHPPRLTLRFAYGIPRTPTEGLGAPFAVFEFHDVQIWQWEDDHDLFDVPEDVRGQVESFDWYEPTNTYDLHAINTRLLFSARRLVVRVEPAVHWVARDTTVSSVAPAVSEVDGPDDQPLRDPGRGR
ncbi:hypothetical protein O2W14_07710 [Modestobacter sp. VKM Ac-2986]|uniref:hypothetical protein n=1 Tax=Modestobacter sp. VKM Ac-2986 TaxID=3004140 RepID=UPI0022AB14D2|nr:hypothetical protein [Modestobacter sp. VKM Ac-2986]MCZ2828712.1 hypothetical protein [Modestobacter sp. VKM Ac-2986]